jgi:hypothetical protein
MQTRFKIKTLYRDKGDERDKAQSFYLATENAGTSDQPRIFKVLKL